MIKINNRKVIAEVAAKTYRANVKRNLLTIFSMLLTSFLIVTVLSIGSSYWDTINLRQLRMSGADYDIELTEPRADQVDIIRGMESVEKAGVSVKCGIVKSYKEKALGKVKLFWYDETAWKEQCIPALEKMTGSYPTQEREIMLSTSALGVMGIKNPVVGMKLPLKYNILSEQNNGETVEKEFVLSGFYRDYAGAEKGLVSEVFYQQTGVKQTDLTQGVLWITLKNSLYSEEDIVEMQDAVSLGEDQVIMGDYDTIENFIKMIIALTGLLGMIFITGYLFIYNTLYISITKDIRYYGQLKTMGMTSVQLRGIVTRTILWNSIPGISFGLLLGMVAARGIIPQIILSSNPTLQRSEIASVAWWIYLLAAVFSFLTNLISSRKPAKMVGECPPIEAIRHIGEYQWNKKKTRRSEGGDMLSMAYRNIFRNRKQAFVIFASFVVAGTLFLIINVVMQENDAKTIANAFFSYDLRIGNDTFMEETGQPKQLLTEEKIQQVRGIAGVKQVGVVSSTEAVVPYQEDVFGTYYKNLYASRWTPGGDYETAMASYKEDSMVGNGQFTARLVGIDRVVFDKLNNELENQLNWQEFKDGKTAIIAPLLMHDIEVGNVVGKAVNFSLPDGRASKSTQKILIGGAVSNDPASLAAGYTPDIIVSQDYMDNLMQEPLVELLEVDYKEPLSKSSEKAVRDVFTGEKFTFESKLSYYEEMKQIEQRIRVLGSGLAIIMAFLALLNYFNMAVAGIQERLKEFATLESIGMTAKQIQKMLALEGVGYWMISIAISIIIGIPFSYLVFQNTKVYEVPYVVPWGICIGFFAAILVMCVLIPIVAYRKAHKETIIIRLKATD